MSERLYSATEVRRLLKDKEATLDDYLLQIYYTLMDSQDYISNEHRIRLNNVIFNNFKQIKVELETRVLVPRILEKSLEIVKNKPKYVSMALNFDRYLPTKPVVIQYFDPQYGLQSFIIHCIDNDYNFYNLLRLCDICSRMVSYCGAIYDLDYNIPHPELPVCDNFEQILFDTVYDYFPINLVDCLRHFGDYITNLPPTKPVIEDLKQLYHKWCTTPTIINVEYFEAILTNFNKLAKHLEEHEMLPKSIAMFFDDKSSQFYLSFTLEIYTKLHSCCIYREAVVFYCRLFDLLQDYEILKDSLQVSPMTGRFLDESADKTEILEFIGLTYERIYMITKRYHCDYANFGNFKWVLLHRYPFEFDDLHRSYHTVNNLEGCIDDCWNELKREHTNIENVYNLNEQQLKNLPTISQIWCEIFKICNNTIKVERIENIVCYILSMSATNYQSYYREFNGDTTKMIYDFNRSITREIIDDTRGFLSDDLRVLAQKIVDDHRINRVED